MATPGNEGDEAERPATELREVSLDEAIAIAILLQKNGQLEDAECLYRKIFAVAPNHPVALHYSGVLAHQQGRSEEGVALIHRSLEADPAQADWHNNLGIVLKTIGRTEDAVFAYRHAIALDPHHAKAHNNLGVVLKRQGHSIEAEAEYRAAIDLDPRYAEPHHNLGALLADRGRAPEAVTCFNRALVLQPETKETRRLLALAYCALGERPKAVDIYERWLQEEPDSPIARHMLAACSGEGVPERAADTYVEKIFDDFASSFDTKLARLAYRAPRLVTAMLADTGTQATNSLDVLDAGCGTGLCGPLVRPYARRLVGVDLSGGMLAEARKRNVYDELWKGELTEYLRSSADAFDVIVSADTLVYFGSLEEVITAAAGALRPGGWLIFTLEERTPAAGAGSAADASQGSRSGASAEHARVEYELETHGRYVHALEYVDAVLRRTGFRPVIARAELRMESGLPVAGLVVRAARVADVEPCACGVDDD
jgi:predicted TPR repeat methyltransferase